MSKKIYSVRILFLNIGRNLKDFTVFVLVPKVSHSLGFFPVDNPPSIVNEYCLAPGTGSQLDLPAYT